jgi:hypothetical protein
MADGDNITPLRPVGSAKDRTAAERKRRSRARKRRSRVGTVPTVTRTVTGHSALAPPVTPPTVTQTVTPSVTVTSGNDPQYKTVAPFTRSRSGAIDVTAYVTAAGLTTVAALFSIKGMVQLFPGTPALIIAMAVAMEGSKLVTAGWLASQWRLTSWIWRVVLITLIAGLALINAAGVASQLVAAHVGDRGTAQSAVETQDATLAARIDVQAHAVADLDRRLGQIDSAIEEAARRGRTNTALSAIEGQRRARAALVDERKREGSALAALKAERASLAAQGRQIETEAAPIRYVAELIGADTDSERAIRWLIALIVLCCDPLAIALTAAASARRTA